MTRDQDDGRRRRSKGDRSIPNLSLELRRRIGRKVRFLRERRCWNQVDLAAKARISVASVSRIECADERVTWDKIRDVARALGTTIEELEASDDGPDRAEARPVGASAWTEFQARQSEAMGGWESEDVFGASRQAGVDIPAMPLGKIYVEPAIEIEEAEKPVLGALEVLLRENPVVVISADFGMGKTLTARVLASRLARRRWTGRDPAETGKFPLFATCLDVLLGDPTCSAAELQARVILAMERGLGRDVSLEQAITMAPPVDLPTLTILDGFDEVPLAEETALHFFRRLRDAAGATRRFVVFTRPAVIPKGLKSLGVIVRSLLPFDAGRARRWFTAWNALSGQRSPVDVPAVMKSPALAELRSIPILCFMLAAMGGPVPAEKATPASLYERFGRQLARGKLALMGEHLRIVDAACKVLQVRPKPPAPVVGVASDREARQIDALMWLMGRMAWESHVLESRDDGRHGRDASATPFASAPDLLSVTHLENALSSLLGPGIGDISSLCTTLLLGVQGSLRDPERYLFFGHRSFREFFVARYWLSELLELSTLPAESRPARERELCRGPLLRRGDRAFDFLAELLAALPRDVQERLAAWGSGEFNDESLSSGARCLSEDRRFSLRNAALGVASVCSAEGVLVDGRAKLRSVLVHMWMSANWELVRAPRLRHRGAKLSSVDLSDARLEGADLREAELITTDLTRGHLRGADLRGADLTTADLSDADLRGADLSGAEMLGAQLMNADLRGAKLQRAVLSQANLLEADLRGANLQQAVLTEASFLGADLRGADLTDADLSDIMGLDTEGPESDKDSERRHSWMTVCRS